MSCFLIELWLENLTLKEVCRMKKAPALFIIMLITLIFITLPGCTSNSNLDALDDMTLDDMTYEIPRKDKLSVGDYAKYSSSNYTVVTHPTASMLSTIKPNDRLFIDKKSYASDLPKRFDIVMFSLPDNQEDSYVKRIIGLPGETLEIKDGFVYINNSSEYLSEPYLAEQPLGSDYGPYAIPDNHYFVMGDNRNNSYDSRRWQEPCIPLEAIEGKVVLIVSVE